MTIFKPYVLILKGKEEKDSNNCAIRPSFW